MGDLAAAQDVLPADPDRRPRGRGRATGTLDRAPLGMRAPRPLIGRYVRIVVEAELEPPS
ncbi:hypothetical protein [Amycolatopsis mediterranei]|uniref:Uncharacterized protein n=1 Tax=Amycolatopsis mediterranei (strain S699) TaxID=713604 RepID=A0A9R0U6Q7_AMYMS|nr:hypothetical protein RAM_06860 [Amycolatopsis mediterranei S699]KDO05077.1 hypothetical protein DV26_40755 [Amycolatopsis mediterranei]KDU90207.1 hypothetical protein DV36_21170 [Amycolatopsis mediterranei]